MAKVQKLILDVEAIDEEFFEDVFLIGIVSAKQAHQFVWHINESFNIEFEKNHSFDPHIKDVFFKAFTFIESNLFREHFIFSNRNNQHYLLPEAKNVDYLWMLKGGHDTLQKTNEILQILPKIRPVNFAFLINTNGLKNRQNLIV